MGELVMRRQEMGGEGRGGGKWEGDRKMCNRHRALWQRSELEAMWAE